MHTACVVRRPTSISSARSRVGLPHMCMPPGGARLRSQQAAVPAPLTHPSRTITPPHLETHHTPTPGGAGLYFHQAALPAPLPQATKDAANRQSPSPPKKPLVQVERDYISIKLQSGEEERVPYGVCLWSAGGRRSARGGGRSGCMGVVWLRPCKAAVGGGGGVPSQGGRDLASVVPLHRVSPGRLQLATARGGGRALACVAPHPATPTRRLQATARGRWCGSWWAPSPRRRNSTKRRTRRSTSSASTPTSAS